MTDAQPNRPRARELGIAVGILPPGGHNAITDVAGVRVGHATLIVGESIRTGVTAILPHEGNLFQERVPAAVHVFNGFGKLIGATQVQELGEIETPIVLTNTLAAPRAADALIDWTLEQAGNEKVRSVNPLVGETNDGYLNDIRERKVTRAHVMEAITSARGGAVEEGCVGAGTGTVAFGFKGGIGTSSRVVPPGVGGSAGCTVGVLAQSNFGGVLTIAGAPVGRELGKYYLKDKLESPDGSIMIIVATDAALDERQLNRLAARATFGLARTGSSGGHGSGDYVIAFSTANRIRPGESTRTTQTLADACISPLFQAVMEATEEAIYNSLFAGTSMTGCDGNRVEALPIDPTMQIVRRYGAAK